MLQNSFDKFFDERSSRRYNNIYNFNLQGYIYMHIYVLKARFLNMNENIIENMDISKLENYLKNVA